MTRPLVGLARPQVKFVDSSIILGTAFAALVPSAACKVIKGVFAKRTSIAARACSPLHAAKHLTDQLGIGGCGTLCQRPRKLCTHR